MHLKYAFNNRYFFKYSYCFDQGSIAIAGECIKWLRDNLGIIPDSKSSGLFNNKNT